MASRQDFQDLLAEILGSSNVYFQPPASISMQYPCIVYKRDDMRMEYADNGIYKNKKRYQVTAISLDPDSDLHEKLATLPLCTFDRFFTADNLNHDVFNIFF